MKKIRIYLHFFAFLVYCCCCCSECGRCLYTRAKYRDSKRSQWLWCIAYLIGSSSRHWHDHCFGPARINWQSYWNWVNKENPLFREHWTQTYAVYRNVIVIAWTRAHTNMTSVSSYCRRPCERFQLKSLINLHWEKICLERIERRITQNVRLCCKHLFLLAINVRNVQLRDHCMHKPS